MMKSIQILMDEHKLILRGLRVAQVMAKRFHEAGAAHASDLKGWLDFVGSYADTFHHKKEEDVLFVWMKEKGFPTEGGPITVMLYEHDIGRALIKSIVEASALAFSGDKVALETVSAALIDFAGHLSNHIYKEDNILYPMAERLAATGDDESLLARYEVKLAAVEAGATQKKYAALIEELEGKYNEL
jgi:hemerythrin-like domain-containing protein